MMRTIKLLGEAGRIFGREFRLNVNSAAEAIRALRCQLKGFEKYLYDSSENGIYWRVVDGDPEGLEEDHLGYPLENNTLVLAPIVSGGGGFGRVLLGIGLIAASAFMPATVLGVSSMTIGLMGGALVLGGLSQMIAGKPKTPKENERKDSFLFDRSSQVSNQGRCVPKGYGERVIELKLILSSGVRTNDIPI
jgi:predicted phage tail protein